MSKIAREISKRVSVVALATALAVQAVPVNAVELEDINDAKVVETTEEKAEAKPETVEDKKTVEPKNEEIKSVVEAKESEVINIPDKDVEKGIREQLSLPEDKKITKEDMEKLTYMYIKGNPKTLEGLKYAVNLTRLDIYDSTNIDDMSVINKLSKIEVLYNIEGSFDLNNVSELKNLRYMYIGEVPNENLDAITSDKMTDLMIFKAENMRDISSLSKMKDLKTLVLKGGENKKSPLTDISPIVNLKKITTLNLSNTSVSDFNTLVNLNTYEYLILNNCNITDISGLPQYPELVEECEMKISLNGNKIADPTPIFTTLYWVQSYAKQNVVLPEIVTEAGNVVYKIPYGEYVTDVEIDENVGKYNPETKEITFYNITSDQDVTYKVRAHNGFDGSDDNAIFNVVGFEPRYDYSATVTQPIRMPRPEPEVKPEPGTKDENLVSEPNTSQTTNKVSEKSPKTGDAGALGVLSLAVVSLAGAVKSRKRK